MILIYSMKCQNVGQWMNYTVKKGTRDKKILGTPDYLSPELILGVEAGPYSDWWAVGVIMYEFLCGMPPFNDTTVPAIFSKIQNREIEWPEEGYVSAEAIDLMEKLLDPDPNTRLGCKGAEEIMSHPWFNGIKWESLYQQPMDHFFVPHPESEHSTDFFSDRKGFKQEPHLLSFYRESPSVQRRITAINADISSASILNFKDYEFKNVDVLKIMNSNHLKSLVLHSNQNSPLRNQNHKRIIISHSNKNTLKTKSSNHTTTASFPKIL